MNEIGSYRLMYLNNCSQVGRTVWEVLGCIALLEEHNDDVLWGFKCPFYSVLFLSLFCLLA